MKKHLQILLGVCLLSGWLPPLRAAPDGHIADAVVSASGLKFINDIMATRPGDPRLYVLLGSGFIRTMRAGDATIFVSDWLDKHPHAIVTPVSRMISTNTKTRKPFEIVYIWIEDGRANLNVDLVRAGMFPGNTMIDMVDNAKGLDVVLQRPEMAGARAQIERERAAAPQDRTERLISESRYEAHIRQFGKAERHAQAEKLGLWSDAMKEQRQAEVAQ